MTAGVRSNPPGEPDAPLSPAELDRALEAVWLRVDATLQAAGERFPVFADPRTGGWLTSRQGSWISGFWVGLLVLRADLTGDTAAVSCASRWTEKLTGKLHDDTVTRAMTFWYGAALGARVLGDPQAADLACRGARELAAAFSPEMGAVPTGTALGIGDTGRRTVSADSLGALVRLLSWAHDNTGDDLLIQVAEQQIGRFVEASEPGGVLPTELAWDARANALVAHPSAGEAWARGDAWVLLATVDACTALGPAFLPQAERAAHRWLRRHGRAIPVDSPGVPGSLVDTAAAAIASVAFRKLALIGPCSVPDPVEIADHLLATLVRQWLGGCDAEPGRLLGGCYETRPGARAEVESVWGTFFLAVSLATAAGRLGPTVS